jgi:hypothetical protein
MTDCMKAVAWWFGSSSGLYVMLGVTFVLGVLAGFGVAPHLPHRLRSILGV